MMKTCNKCLLSKSKEFFGKNEYHCKECQSKIRKQYYQANKEKLKVQVKIWHDANKEKVRAHQRKSIRQIKSRFKFAQRQALTGSKDWSLSIEQYELLISNPCFYCNGFFPKVETGCGLDRKDNSKGYQIDNVVSCCYNCNKIKNDILSSDETVRVIALIVSMRTSG